MIHPSPAVIEGWGVRLEPLEPHHAEALFAAASEETFRWFSIRPEPLVLGWFQEYVRERTSPGSVGLAVLSEGKVVGSSTFFDIRPEHDALEIGYSWLTASVQGTHVNPAMKLLMIDHAVSQWGVERIQLKTDLLNLQSQAAMTKMGAVREGVLRHNRVVQGGRRRDDVYFSILAGEWPEVRSRLVTRLQSLGKAESDRGGS